MISLKIAAAPILVLFTFAGAVAGERDSFNPPCEVAQAGACAWGNLERRNLDGMDLSDSNYKAVHMHGASLRRAMLARLDLQTADVSDADFTDADLNHASFFAANAGKTVFAGADLSGANFTRANLVGADFRGAKVDQMTLFIGSRLAGAIWIDGRICSPGSIGVCN